MATLVSQDPKTGTCQPLHNCIQGPQHASDWRRGDILWSDKVVEDIEGGGEHRNITSDVAQALGCRPLITVSRNGVTNLVDREIWELELVPVCVEHLAATLLDLEDIGRVQ